MPRRGDRFPADKSEIMSESHATAVDHHGPKHHYHLVDPSPWPLIGSLCAGALAAGAVWWLHNGSAVVMIIGFVAVLAMMFMWWRDVIKEATFRHLHSP